MLLFQSLTLLFVYVFVTVQSKPHFDIQYGKTGSLEAHGHGTKCPSNPIKDNWQQQSDIVFEHDGDSTLKLDGAPPLEPKKQPSSAKIEGSLEKGGNINGKGSLSAEGGGFSWKAPSLDLHSSGSLSSNLKNSAAASIGSDFLGLLKKGANDLKEKKEAVHQKIKSDIGAVHSKAAEYAGKFKNDIHKAAEAAGSSSFNGGSFNVEFPKYNAAGSKSLNVGAGASGAASATAR